MSINVSSDFIGRIANISLAPSPANALVPLFEAVMNSIQAIEDRFGSDNLTRGSIEIEIFRDGDEGLVQSFEVRDNGIGFDAANLKSFAKSDSRHKEKRGGKGIGRFMWLKVFDAVRIDSRFGPDPSDTLGFDFLFSDHDQIRNEGETSAVPSIGTVVKLASMKSEYRSVCPKKAETLQAKLISHFLSYFVNLNTPKMVLIDGERFDLFEVFADYVKEDHERSFTVDQGSATHKFKLSCYLLPKHLSDDEKGNNAIFYGANGRSVVRTPIDNAIGLAVIGGKYVYYAFVSGDYLDKHVTQERTAFSWPDEMKADVNTKALQISKEFLADYITEIRKAQTERVARLLSEHLRFMTVVDDPAVFAATLELSTQSDEEIYLELSRTSLRKEKKVRRDYTRAKTSKVKIDADVKTFAKELGKESLASLAEYVYKRKLILNVLDDHLRYQELDKENYHLEEMVHELICPLRATKEELSYKDHNLWIVDDQLAFYSYFNSDKTLKSITGGADSSTKEPDVTFFDLGIGMDRAGTVEPVNIIEFKRPGRDDYTLSDNPIIQLRDYCTRIREAGRVVSHDGRELRAVDWTTPFSGHIIADITPSLEKMMRQFGPYTQKAGHRCFYKWDEDFSMFIQIQSYADLLRGARARNEAFFVHLGISN